MQSSDILKEFGFHTEEIKKTNLPDELTLVIKTGQHYTIKTTDVCKVSSFIANAIDNPVELPDGIDEKYMMFLIDYVNFIGQNKGVPEYDIKKIETATTLENAVGSVLHKLFEKHFNYKFMRSDVAVKHYLKIFGHFLKCSTIIISEPLITLFAIAHKIIIQHLPSSEFIIVDE